MVNVEEIPAGEGRGERDRDDIYCLLNKLSITNFNIPSPVEASRPCSLCGSLRVHRVYRTPIPEAGYLFLCNPCYRRVGSLMRLQGLTFQELCLMAMAEYVEKRRSVVGVA